MKKKKGKGRKDKIKGMRWRKKQGEMEEMGQKGTRKREVGCEAARVTAESPPQVTVSTGARCLGPGGPGGSQPGV